MFRSARTAGASPTPDRTLRAPRRIDARLHPERLGERRERTSAALADGVFVLRDGAPRLVLGPVLRRWTAAGYAEAIDRPAGGQPSVVTPPSIVAVLAAGAAADGRAVPASVRSG